MSDDATQTRGCASERTKQNLGRAIPQRDHLVRVSAHRDACDAASQRAARATLAAHAVALSARRSASMLIDAAQRELKPPRVTEDRVVVA